MSTNEWFKSLSSLLLCIVFTSSALGCMWQINAHSSSLCKVILLKSNNEHYIRYLVVCLCLLEIISVLFTTLPFLQGPQSHSNARVLARLCLVASSIFELFVHVILGDYSTSVSFVFILATCVLFVLDELNLREVHTFRDGIIEGHFDYTFSSIVACASRCRAASISLVLIVVILIHASMTMESLIWESTPLGQRLAMRTWFKAGSVISFVACVASVDKSRKTKTI